MDKVAYYIEYPDKGFVTIFKPDFEDSEIWTAEEADSEAFIASLKKDGYEVIHFVSAAYEYKGAGRTRRKWHRVETISERMNRVLSSFAQNKAVLERWEKEDEAAYPDVEKRRRRIMDVIEANAKANAKANAAK